METKPILVTTPAGDFELREYTITDKFTVKALFRPNREMGYVTCPFCKTRTLVEIKTFNACAPNCSGRYSTVPIVNCGAKFYPFPLFPNDNRIFCKSGRPYQKPNK
ncbi:MAG: hypothetical protein WCO63_01375 [Bacteroidota bacterium]